MKIIQELNLIAFLLEDREGSELDVAMWHSDKNECEFADKWSCITESGIYFGTPDSHEPKFCPRHFFHETGYKIEPKGKQQKDERMYKCSKCGREYYLSNLEPFCHPNKTQIQI